MKSKKVFYSMFGAFFLFGTFLTTLSASAASDIISISPSSSSSSFDFKPPSEQDDEFMFEEGNESFESVMEL